MVPPVDPRYPVRLLPPRAPIRVAVGVDNGVSGGLVALDAATGEVIRKSPMPTHRRRSTEPCPAQITAWLDELGPDLGVWVEDAPDHAPSAQSLRSMAISFGVFLGSAIPHPHVRFVAALAVRDWHDVMLGSYAKGESKARALARASELAGPGTDWRAGPRCRTPHDGIVDAYLIARYGLMNVGPDRLAFKRASAQARRDRRKALEQSFS